MEQLLNKWGGVLYQERHDHGLSCFYLVIYGDALNSSKEPAIKNGESAEKYFERYTNWERTCRGTAEFVNYLEHRSNNRAAKLDFVADYVEQY